MHCTCLPEAVHSCSEWKARVDEAAVALARLVEMVPDRDRFAAREEAILKIGNLVSRQLLAQDLQRSADAYPDEIFVRGTAYRRHERGTVDYHSLCGDISIARDTFRQIGVHNGPTIVPVELEAGIIDSATPALAYSVAQGIAEMPSRRYEEVMRAAHREVPSRSTTERIAKFIGTEVKEQSLNLELVLRLAENVPAEATAIAIGMDRTTVPTAVERGPDEPANTRRKKRAHEYKRKVPAAINVVYRMCYVGTFSLVDANGDPLVTRKYAASAAEGSGDVVYRMMQDVKSAREQRQLPVAIVQDGAPELWGLLWDGLRSIDVKRWTNVLDRYHLVEHVNAVISMVAPKREQEEQRRYWIKELDRDDRATARFARWMEEKCGWDRLNTTPALGSHYSYLFSWSACKATHYKKFRRAGIPQGSGVTEGACKSLITARFKRSGQRWRDDGFTAIATLRAMEQSGRFARMWQRFAPRFTDEIQCRN
jgi:hypothetical protein